MDGFHPPASRAPQPRPAHPLPQRLAADRETLARQVLSGQGGTKAGVTSLAQLPHSPLPAALRDLPIRAATAQPVHDPAIALGAQPCLQTPDLAVGYMQPPGRFDLSQMTFLDLLQQLQPLSFSGAQLDSLRFHPPSRPR